jgi:CHASE2 domain-containing sensor protein
MSRVAGFGRFLYDFVVGDDGTIAAGVALAIGLAALAVHLGLAGWWIPPIALIAALSWSLWRATLKVE